MRYTHTAGFAVLAILLAAQLPTPALAQNENIVVTDFAVSPAQKDFKQLPKG